MHILLLQRKHKTTEINYHTVRAELKEQCKGFFKNIKGEAKAEYWLFKMKHVKVLARKITQLDEGAFQYLKDIHCTKTPSGFKLEFFFDSNPYFKDSVLTKTIHTTRGKKRKVTKTTGMEIEWYPGKSLTETENGDSFFNFFKSPIADTAEEVQRLMEQDYCIGQIIRDRIIPHAISWFTREALEEGGEFEDLQDDDSDDEDVEYC
ncbi:hypothetical protein M0R45_028307 [Rubus argutus]|uniref:Uncharacterized protein n=1 Tax=Rubus argutus TaxID=59490 RepID=A0AAW1W8Q5_RUBAR